MTGIDLPQHPLQELFTISFSDLIESGVVDIVPDPENDVVELQADEWTLHVEGWPIQLAFIALDEDPPTASERMGVLNAALGPQDLGALRDADERLEGALTKALVGSNDPLSASLGQLLRGFSTE
ncbi:MAG: hypothetical protein ACR2OU_13140 [Thermomicrobiales bacterium]